MVGSRAGAYRCGGECAEGRRQRAGPRMQARWQTGRAEKSKCCGNEELLSNLDMS